MSSYSNHVLLYLVELKMQGILPECELYTCTENKFCRSSRFNNRIGGTVSSFLVIEVGELRVFVREKILSSCFIEVACFFYVFVLFTDNVVRTRTDEDERSHLSGECFLFSFGLKVEGLGSSCSEPIIPSVLFVLFFCL